MYKVVIVDDEDDARNRIKSMLDSFDYNIEVVGEYDNGLDAQNAILNDPPDILLTDIKIPYIDGIELAKNISHANLMTKIIIISGYDIFDYAKSALEYGAVSFITKPFTTNDVKENLKKVINILDNEFSVNNTLALLNEFKSQNLGIIIEHDLSRLVNVNEIDQKFAEKIKEDGVPINYDYFAFAVFDFDKNDNEVDYNLYEVFRYKIDSHFESYRDKLHAKSFFRNNRMVEFIASNEPLNKAELSNLFESVLFTMKRVFDLSFTVGVSYFSEAGLKTNFRSLYTKACTALDYRNVIGGNQVIFYDEILDQEYKFLNLDENEYKQIIYLLNYESLDNVNKYIDNLLLKISSEEYRSSSYYISLNILNSVIKGCNSLSLLYKDYQQHNEIIHTFSNLKTPEDINAYIKKVVYEVYQVNQSLKANLIEKYYYKIIMYIDDHYSEDDLSLEKLSLHINLSPSYISSLLKKHDTSFVKYLTNKRIEEAKKLLANPDNKIVKVAREVGYPDPYYFSNCFKKYTGISPREYRQDENKK